MGTKVKNKRSKVIPKAEILLMMLFDINWFPPIKKDIKNNI
jgi:hypothetical protein